MFLHFDSNWQRPNYVTFEILTTWSIGCGLEHVQAFGCHEKMAGFGYCL